MSKDLYAYIKKFLPNSDLLTVEEEIVLAKRIKESRNSLVDGLLSITTTIKEIGTIYARIAEDKVCFRDVAYAQDGKDGDASDPSAEEDSKQKAAQLAQSCWALLAAQDHADNAELEAMRATLSKKIGGIGAALQLKDATLEKLAERVAKFLKLKTKVQGALSSSLPPSQEEIQAWEKQTEEWQARAGVPFDELCQRAERVRDAAHTLRQSKRYLVESNMRFVVHICYNYQDRGLEPADLLQEGNLGLILAAEKFDPQRKAKFSTFAAHKIRAALQHALENKSRTIRVSGHSLRNLSAAHAGEKRKGLSARQAAKLVKINTDILSPDSLDQPLVDGRPVIDVVSDPSAQTPWELLSDKQLKEMISDLFKQLPQEERDVMEGYYGEQGGSCSQIAEDLGLPERTVRNLKAKALKNVTQRARNFPFSDYGLVASETTRAPLAPQRKSTLLRTIPLFNEIPEVLDALKAKGITTSLDLYAALLSAGVKMPTATADVLAFRAGEVVACGRGFPVVTKAACRLAALVEISPQNAFARQLEQAKKQPEPC